MKSLISDTDRARLRELLERATPGPWQVETFPDHESITHGPPEDASDRFSVDDPMERPDMEFCAFARNLAGPLLDENDRLRERVAELERLLKPLADFARFADGGEHMGQEDSKILWAVVMHDTPTLGDCRDARAALLEGK